MRWRCSGCPFQRSAVFKRRIWPLLHLTICCSESDQMVRANHSPTPECNSLQCSVSCYRKPFDSISYGSGMSKRRECVLSNNEPSKSYTESITGIIHELT